VQLAAYSLHFRYGVNPIPYLPNFTQEQLDHQKAVFKRESMKVKRKMLEQPGAAEFIPVDARGEPVWDEA
jgi:hypothetical protein